MPLTQTQKTEAVEYLTTNCDCWKNKSTVLNELDDDTLEGLRADAEHAVVNTLTVNALRDKLEIPVDVTGNAMAEAVVAKSLPAKKSPPPGEEDEEGYVDPKKTPPAPTGNTTGGKKMSLRDALQQHGTPDDLAAWDAVLKHNRDAKLTIVQELVANESDKSERHRLGGELMKKPLADLELMRRLAAPTGNSSGRRQPPRYDAQGVDAYRDPTPVDNSHHGRGDDRGGFRSDDLPDVSLGLPTINYEELAASAG